MLALRSWIFPPWVCGFPYYFSFVPWPSGTHFGEGFMRGQGGRPEDAANAEAPAAPIWAYHLGFKTKPGF